MRTRGLLVTISGKCFDSITLTLFVCLCLVVGSMCGIEYHVFHIGELSLVIPQISFSIYFGEASKVY